MLAILDGMPESKSKTKKKRSSRSSTWQPRVTSLSSVDRINIRAKTLVDERTLRRWAQGDPNVRATTRQRIERACEQLGIELLA